MRFFITGATGFIGTHLTRRVLAEGHQVVALVRSPHKLAAAVAEAIEVVPGDLSLLADPTLVLPPVDVVVHLAGVVTAASPEQYEQINFAAVVDLMDCLERQDWRPRRVLFASSLAAAGPSAPGKAHTEDDPLAPIEDYGQAKARAEAMLAGRTIPSTSFRPCLVLGAGDPATLVFYKLGNWHLGFRVSGPPQALSVVDVSDVVGAILAMAAEEGTQHKRYFVAHPQAVHPAAIFRAVGAAMGKGVWVVPIPRTLLRRVSGLLTGLAGVLGFHNPLDAKQLAQMLAPGFVCSSQQLQAATGWRPDCDLAQATRAAVRGYREMGWL